MKHTLFHPAPSEALKAAIQRYESGLYHQAGMQFLEILAQEPENADARFYYRLIERKLTPRKSQKPTLIWQFNPDQAWESDWLHLLLEDQFEKEVIDNTWSQMTDPMIVVDNRLVPEKVSYYREAFEKGARVILVHLSDEAFKDDLGAYKYCDAVIRNYHSDRLAQYSNIFFLPLGYKAGFARTDQAPKPAPERKHLWSFAGDSKKLTRADMMAAMEKIPNGFAHLTSGFGAADALSTADYRAMLDDTVFAPSPSGWSSLDSFRVYEALEAGCIPIVERRAHFDYFTTLLGPHPIPTISTWTEAPEIIQRIQADDVVERIQQACAAWWAAYKPKLTANLGAFIKTALG